MRLYHDIDHFCDRFRLLSKVFPCLLTLAIVLSLSLDARAQEGDWINLVVEKEEGIMTISVDLSPLEGRPNYKNLFIVGTKFQDCMPNGFPNELALQQIFRFSDSTAVLLEKKTKNKLVGILTYRCMAFDVFYVKDSTGLRDAFQDSFERNFKGRGNYLTLKADRSWDYYRKNLLPSALTDGLIFDQEYLHQLVIQGDDLKGKRKVEHWMYFKTLNKRNKAAERLEKMKFELSAIQYYREKEYPYELKVSRMDQIKPDRVAQLTTELKAIAAYYNGYYDGWGVEVKSTDQP